MGLILTVTAGLVVWIVLWALGAKGFDAFLLAAAIILVGAREDPLRLSARPPQLAPSALARWLARLRAAPCAARRRGGAAARSPAAAASASRARRGDRQPADDLLEPAAAGALGAAAPQQIVNGEKLALARGRRARRAVQDQLRLARRREPTSGEWNPGVTATNAKTAAQDTSTIAYLGDYDSGATRGLAAADQRRGHPAGQPGEPVRRADLLARRRPGRARTLLPDRQTHLRAAAAGRSGAGAAQVQLMQSLGVHSGCTCSTTRTRSRCRSRSSSPATPNAPGITVAGTTAWT